MISFLLEIMLFHFMVFYAVGGLVVLLLPYRVKSLLSLLFGLSISGKNIENHEYSQWPRTMMS